MTTEKGRVRDTRRISWIKAARKDFEAFPQGARLTGLGSGVWELAIKERGDAYRVVYTLQVDEDIWVLHAFQKKARKGIATPKKDIDLVKERIRRLKEALA